LHARPEPGESYTAIDFGLGGRIFIDLHRFACQRRTDAAVMLTGLPVE